PDRPAVGEEPEPVEDLEQVAHAVVDAVRLAPADGELLPHRGVLGQQLGPAPGDLAARGALGGAHSQPTGTQATDELPALDVLRTGRDELGVPGGGHVVVVEVEGAAGDAAPGGEGVELGQARVGDE